MNALIIGPYRQNDGWGAATRDYIKAIATQIKNISIRPIYLAPNVVESLDDDLLVYENSRHNHYDIVFQKALPHCLVPQGLTSKNVGIFTLETNNISHSNSIQLMNQMTELCVPSEQEAQSLKMSGVNIPIRVISQPLNTDYIRQYVDSEHQFNFDTITSKSFKFYTIGEYIDRKNILDIVLAFNLAFDITDNVSLIIKTSKPGYNPQQSHQIIQKDIDQLKQRMNIGLNKNKEVLLTHRLSDANLMALHNTCDCFISASKGEAFCRPAAEALCFGNTPIVTDHTGMTDFINDKNGLLIHSHKTPVVTHERTLSNDFDIYNAYEHWYQPNIYSMIEQMKKIYSMHKNDKEKLSTKRKIGKESIEQFTYNRIGHNICT